MRCSVQRTQRVLNTLLATASRRQTGRVAAAFKPSLARGFSTSDEPLTPFPVHPPHNLPAAPKPVLNFKDAQFKKHAKLDGKLVVLGFGAIGQGILPLLFRHIDMDASQVLIVANEFNDTQLSHANDYGAKTLKAKLTTRDYKNFLNEHVKEGDFLLNVSVDVSSVALIKHCQVSFYIFQHH